MEYNFAQSSAGMAEKWEQFTEDGDDYLQLHGSPGSQVTLRADPSQRSYGERSAGAPD